MGTLEDNIKKHQLEQKMNASAGTGQMSNFEKAFDEYVSDSIEKSQKQLHKYFKREGNKGSYKYYYTESEYNKDKGIKAKSTFEHSPFNTEIQKKAKAEMEKLPKEKLQRILEDYKKSFDRYKTTASREDNEDMQARIDMAEEILGKEDNQTKKFEGPNTDLFLAANKKAQEEKLNDETKEWLSIHRGKSEDEFADLPDSLKQKLKDIAAGKFDKKAEFKTMEELDHAYNKIYNSLKSTTKDRKTLQNKVNEEFKSTYGKSWIDYQDKITGFIRS
jgi:hypothetical protein